MKTQQEIEDRIEYLTNQYSACLKEEKYTAAAIYKAQIQATEWVMN